MFEAVGAVGCTVVVVALELFDTFGKSRGSSFLLKRSRCSG